MRWLWFTPLSIMVFLIGLFTAWRIIWVTELLLVDLFFTRIVNWKIFSFSLRKLVPLNLELLIWFLITILLLRLFIFDSVTVTNLGMHPLVSKSDKILVSKVSFGPRMPLTPFNFPFCHHYLPFSKKPSSLPSPP